MNPYVVCTGAAGRFKQKTSKTRLSVKPRLNWYEYEEGEKADIARRDDIKEAAVYGRSCQ